MTLRDTMLVFDDITHECDRQDALWGEQNHGPEGWLSILTEEVGEVAKEVADSYVGRNPLRTNYRTELVQVAAVALRAIESFDRSEAGA